MLKDFVHVAGPLGVSHFVIFSASDVATNVVSVLCLLDLCSTFMMKG